MPVREVNAAHEGEQAHALLDGQCRFAAVSCAFATLIGCEPASLYGASVADVFADWEGRGARVAGLAASALEALQLAKRTGLAQFGALLEVQLAPDCRGTSQPRRLLRVAVAPLSAAEGVRIYGLLVEEVTQPFESRRLSERAPAGAALEHLDRLRQDSRVHERTLELEHANAQLLREIAEHIKTEKALQRSREQLQHSQRLEALGRLAGSIAHDFNNLLSVVLGYSTTLLDDLPSASQQHADVIEIRGAAERGTELSRQLLAFGSQQSLSPRILDLGDSVLHIERMVRRILGEDIELVTLLASSPWKVKVDPGQIEQVLMNLVVNARDAMPHGGTLTIETATVMLDEDHVSTYPEAAAGPYVVLSVSDTGLGMNEETQSRAFEPFFTTKEDGKGSGLGLATVFGIVKQSGGHIYLHSEPGRGTTFKLCFPRSSEAETKHVAAPVDAALPDGHETILLVEDDPQLRQMARKILIRCGYQVLDAPNGADALVFSARFSGTIDLLLTDVVMPQMNGHELARRLMAERSTIKVLYMSGYTDNAVLRQSVLKPNEAYIQKPLRPHTLAARVRQLLDGECATAS